MLFYLDTLEDVLLKMERDWQDEKNMLFKTLKCQGISWEIVKFNPHTPDCIICLDAVMCYCHEMLTKGARNMWMTTCTSLIKMNMDSDKHITV